MASFNSRLLEKFAVFPVALFFQVRRGDELQGRRIDAVPQAGGFGSVVEEMTQV
jgi:hypothetical protein